MVGYFCARTIIFYLILFSARVSPVGFLSNDGAFTDFRAAIFMLCCYVIEVEVNKTFPDFESGVQKTKPNFLHGYFLFLSSCSDGFFFQNIFWLNRNRCLCGRDHCATGKAATFSWFCCVFYAFTLHPDLLFLFAVVSFSPRYVKLCTQCKKSPV